MPRLRQREVERAGFSPRTESGGHLQQTHTPVGGIAADHPRRVVGTAIVDQEKLDFVQGIIELLKRDDRVGDDASFIVAGHRYRYAGKFGVGNLREILQRMASTPIINVPEKKEGSGSPA